MLTGLHEAEMPFRQHQRFVTRDRAENRNAKRHQRIRNQAAVPLTAKLVEHYTADTHRRMV